MHRNQPLSHSLLILLWNTNGVLNHRDQLEIILNDRLIDIALLCETHLTPQRRFFLRNFTIYRSDHPDGTAHGGTAIAIRSNLVHHLVPLDQHNFLQATAVHLSSSPFPFTLASVYCPPRFTVSSQMFTTFFRSLGPRFVAGGDFNSKHLVWGSRLNNPRGRNLYNSLTSNNYAFISPPAPTYWPTALNKQPDILDFFVTNNLNTFSSIHFIDELSSDHSCLELTLSSAPICMPLKPSLTRGRIDWDAFASNVHNTTILNIPLKSIDDIEAAVESFNRTIQQAAWSACSETLTTSYRAKPPHYPSYIRTLIRDKRKARKAWQNSRRPLDKVFYNRLNNQLKDHIKRFKSHIFNNEISSLTTDDNSLWMKTKRLLKYHSPSNPLRRADGTWLSSDCDKASEFASHLSKVFCPHPDIINHAKVSEIKSFLLSPLPLELPPKCFKPNEVWNQILRLPKRKSPGYDLLTAEVLQKLPKKAILLLTYIFNAIIRTTKIPIQWKYSLIRMIHKPDKPFTDPSSYRPISLLPLCSKVFEKLLLYRILPLVHDAGILPNHQFGFRAGHSTVHQLHRVVDFLATALEQKRYAAGIFLDVSQAFDRVWIDGLLSKLKFLPPTYYLILQSFLTDRYFSVSQGTAQSNPLPILSGVPQGSILAPLLYSLFTSDIPTDTDTLLASYADDTVILSSSENSNDVSLNLQHHVTKLEEWFLDWRIKINPTKSTHVTFTLRKQTCPSVFMYGSAIPFSHKVRYLGLHIDRRLTWNTHIDTKRKTLEIRRKQLYSLLGKHSKLPLHLKLLVYKTVIRPIWMYGSQIFCSAKPSVVAKLQRFQSKFLRLISNAPWFVSNQTLHKDLHMPFIHDTFRHLYTRFKEKLPDNINPLIRNLNTQHYLPTNPRRRLRRKWSRDILL